MCRYLNSGAPAPLIGEFPLEDYTLGLALFDFLPPLFTALGLILLCRLTRAVARPLFPLAVLGSSLVILGGSLKASWKLLWVTTAVDHAWMSAGLFWCMAPGFILLAGVGLGLLRSDRGHETGTGLLLTPALVAGIGIASSITGLLPSKILNLAMTVLGNLVLMVSLIMLSSRRRRYAAAGLLVVNVALTFTLSGLARIEDQTASLQWMEEILNFFAQGAFAWAMLILWRDNQKPTRQEQTHEQ